MTPSGSWGGDPWDASGLAWDGTGAGGSPVGRTAFASTGVRAGIDPGRSTGRAAAEVATELASTGVRAGIDPGRSTGKAR